MPTNVEIKARVTDIANLRKRAAQLSGTDGQTLEQEDTFFNCHNGRLKLRVEKGNPSELIFYSRPDQQGPKVSDFSKAGIDQPENLKVVLSQALGVRGMVKKTRYLYMVGQTRVHVDQVDGLGDFMELEVNLKEGQSAEEGQVIARDLMQKLGVKDEDLLTCAYMDLLLNEKSG
ncbi:hypothetical protein BaRGS_00031571 [Batillaria attramentaria]|uniref:CYTH domain-containing protein n=1 Tax=Batillaria attramentaria TaxID=370345 RepID=A0ABD0JQ35_9CAEN